MSPEPALPRPPAPTRAVPWRFLTRAALLGLVGLLGPKAPLAPLPTRGHTFAVTKVEMEIESAELRLTFWLNPPDLLQNVLGDTLGRRSFEDLPHLRREARRIGDYVAGHTALRVDGQPLPPRDRGGWPPEVLPPAPPDGERDAEGRLVPPALPLTLRYRLPEGGARLDLELSHYAGEGFVALFDVASRRVGSPYVRNDYIRAGQELHFDLRDAGLGEPPGVRAETRPEPRAAGAVAGPPAAAAGAAEGHPPARTVRRFLSGGFARIVPGGLDQVLFVLALVLLAPRPGSRVTQLTAFALAHSLALALAALGIVRMPWRVVEPLIALSLVVVALDNVVRREVTPARRLIVFGLGLIHGFGFAVALSRLGVPEGHRLPALISFNVGVELGLLAVLVAAGIVLTPVVRQEWYVRRVAIPASLVIAAVGLFRAIQRTLQVS